jgi:hypothetical protein
MRYQQTAAQSAIIIYSLALGACSAAPAVPTRSFNGYESALAVRINAAALDPSVHLMGGSTRGFGKLPAPFDGPSHRLHSDSDYGYEDAGQGGLSILQRTAPKKRVNLVAFHTLYHGAQWPGGTQINLDAPVQNQIGDVLLYAPTMKAPNGDCIEAGTAYYNGGSYTNYQTHAYIYAFDWCGGPGKTITPDLVKNWFTKYVRVNGDGIPEYAVQLCNCTGPKSWSVRYYNYETNKFDTFYSTTGYYRGFGRGGWTQFETQYNVEQGTSAPCSPNLPPIEDTSVHFVEGNQNVYLTPQNSKLYQPLPGENSFGAWGDCFNYNKTPASYDFTLPHGVYDSWEVVSTGY